MLITFATRHSSLARWQTQWVSRQLESFWPSLVCRELMVTTQGDIKLDHPLPDIGGKGVFTMELESELLTRHVQAAVHSLKDLPVENNPELTIGAIPVRADVRDVLVSARGLTLMELPDGARVGTSSLRRSAQLLALRPDLQIESLRGNVDTRLRKAREGQYDAIVLAGAGLARLGLEQFITEWLSLDMMLPAPGQGALAVQCRADDDETLGLLAPLEDSQTRVAVTAERAFLSGLGGGCAVPVAAYAAPQITGDTSAIELTGLVASLDGRRLLRLRGMGPDPVLLGAQLAQEAISQGAHEILSSVIKL
jgi:hydroxymethylbilane synthase